MPLVATAVRMAGVNRATLTIVHVIVPFALIVPEQYIDSLGVFSDAAVDRITEYSEGIPRVISLVCDHSLLFGYADQKRRIDRQTVNQAIAYLEDGAAPPRRLARVRGAISRRLLRGGLWSVAATRWCTV